ncbi:MAG: IclR family transcriptional regulator C-terminal domain-containing protein [Porticoccaceae bacterium]
MPSNSTPSGTATGAGKTPPKADGMGGFAKGLKVIETFSTAMEPLTIAEVAQLTGLDRATSRRCILTLVNSGYALAEGRRFKLTPKVLLLSQSYLNASLPQLLQPSLESLAEQLDESCSSAVLDGIDIIYIARASRRRVMSINLNPGSRLPAYCTSMGRVLLANLAAEEAYDVLARSNRVPLTQHTITDIDVLMKELERIRASGYAIIDQELETGLSSIAVPIRNTAGKTVAALNVGMQSSRAAKDKLTGTFLPLMLRVQNQLCEILH